jgi:acyl-CoA hydrolase
MIVLPSGAENNQSSRIVLPSATLGPVLLGRMDVDIVVTEYGVADLRGLDYAARAAALISIAPPIFREPLSSGWRDLFKTF